MACSILEAGCRTRGDSLLTNCKWLSMWQLIQLNRLVLLWTTLHTSTGSYWGECMVSTSGGREARSVAKWHVKSSNRPRLDLTKKSCKHRAIDDWNKLPEGLRMEVKLGKFKLELKSWMLQNVTQTRLIEIFYFFVISS